MPSGRPPEKGETAMNILCIGDVVGSVGCQFLRQRLPSLKKLKSVDLVIANGENSADGNGLTPASAGYLFHSGVDVITTGNHAFRRRESYALYEEHPYVLRPANFPEGTTPGRGSCLVDLGRLIWKAWTAPSVPRIGFWPNQTGQKSPSWISMPRPPEKNGLWGFIWTAGSPPCSALIPTFKRPTKRFYPGAPAISLTRA